jgi:hypothetical protein
VPLLFLSSSHVPHRQPESNYAYTDRNASADLSNDSNYGYFKSSLTSQHSKHPSLLTIIDTATAATSTATTMASNKRINLNSRKSIVKVVSSNNGFSTKISDDDDGSCTLNMNQEGDISSSGSDILNCTTLLSAIPNDPMLQREQQVPSLQRALSGANATDTGTTVAAAMEIMVGTFADESSPAAATKKTTAFADGKRFEDFITTVLSTAVSTGHSSPIVDVPISPSTATIAGAARDEYTPQQGTSTTGDGSSRSSTYKGTPTALITGDSTFSKDVPISPSTATIAGAARDEDTTSQQRTSATGDGSISRSPTSKVTPTTVVTGVSSPTKDVPLSPTTATIAGTARDEDTPQQRTSATDDGSSSRSPTSKVTPTTVVTGDSSPTKDVSMSPSTATSAGAAHNEDTPQQRTPATGGGSTSSSRSPTWKSKPPANKESFAKKGSDGDSFSKSNKPTMQRWKEKIFPLLQYCGVCAPCKEKPCGQCRLCMMKDKPKTSISNKKMHPKMKHTHLHCIHKCCDQNSKIPEASHAMKILKWYGNEIDYTWHYINELMDEDARTVKHNFRFELNMSVYCWWPSSLVRKICHLRIRTNNEY